MEEETVEVLYNTKYGGFGVSEKAEELYVKYKKEADPEVVIGPLEFIHFARTSPFWLRVFHELGDEFNSPYCKAAVKVIPKRYRYFYRIDEYDGKETVLIDHQKYELDQIKTILKSTDSNDEKIRQMVRFVELKGPNGGSPY